MSAATMGYQTVPSRQRKARSQAQRQWHGAQWVRRMVRRLDRMRRVTFTLHQERGR